jgi:hypothetical protein
MQDAGLVTVTLPLAVPVELNVWSALNVKLPETPMSETFVV